MDVKEKIIIALDVGTKPEALALAGALKEAQVFKIGMELFTAEGPRSSRTPSDSAKSLSSTSSTTTFPIPSPGRLGRLPGAASSCSRFTLQEAGR